MRKAGSLVIAILLTFCMVITPAFAIEESDETEITTVFDDVNSNDWYYDSVMKMYESNIIKGYGDRRFGPNDKITHAQVLTILVRLADIDTTKYKDGSSWYSDVAGWAKLNIDGLPSNLSTPATRFDISKYIVDIFKLENIDETSNEDVNNPFSDTNNSDALILYKYGITVGVPKEDGTLVFNGDSNLTRAQTCVMLDRLLEVEKPVWETDLRTEVQLHYSSLLDYSYYDNIKEPDGSLTIENFTNAWMYAMYTGCGEVDIHSDTRLNRSEIDAVKEDIIYSWYLARNKVLAHSSFYNSISVGCKFSGSADANERYNCTFTLKCKSKSQDIEEIKANISDFEYQCAQIIDEMYASGKLNNSMTMKEKSKVLYEYLDYRLQYDLTYQNSGAYATLRDNTGTCNGYTGLYNYLCTLAGIPMEAASGTGDTGSHIWSKINIDGINYHTDVTWGDPIPDRPNYSNPKWFWKPFSEFEQHTLDEYSLE